MTSPRPLKLLIAALGGEGGGVLTDWIVTAAGDEGLPVQSTSIPGVAQRTGATTYYIEIFPVPVAQLGGRAPVFALTPSAGDVDVMVASEMLEAGRAIGSGMLARDKTVLVASLHRVYAMAEKTAMADGRFDSGRLFRAIEQGTRQAFLFDMEACARDAKSALNAVMLGALAGTGALPIAIERFEAAIRNEGKAVESNLRGFRAGLAQVRGEGATKRTADSKRPHKAMPGAEALLQRARVELPEGALTLANEGIKRLVGYQGQDYAKLYLDRLTRVNAVERSLGGGGEIVRDTARQLAVRMSYEDVIRVAQLKSDPARFQRIEAEVGAAQQPLIVVDYFKPGFEELCSILPPAFGAAHPRPRAPARLDGGRLSRHGSALDQRVGLCAAAPLGGAQTLAAEEPPFRRGAGEKVTLEEMGGAKMHTSVSGCGDVLAKDEPSAIAWARAYLAYLPQNAGEAPGRVEARPPRADAKPLADVIVADENKAFDMKKVIDAVVDEGSFFEIEAVRQGALDRLRAHRRARGRRRRQPAEAPRRCVVRR